MRQKEEREEGKEGGGGRGRERGGGGGGSHNTCMCTEVKIITFQCVPALSGSHLQ